MIARVEINNSVWVGGKKDPKSASVDSPDTPPRAKTIGEGEMVRLPLQL